MKKLTLVAILLLFASFANAEINVLNQIEQIYNINEKIPLKVVVGYEKELDGFVKSSAICDNTKVDYFVSPFTLKQSPQELTIPDLRLTKNMLGKCSLEISLTDSENNLLDKKVAKIFEVSDNLILTVALNKDKLNPNDELKISGDVKNVRGELLNQGNVKILLDDNEVSAPLDKGKFSYNYQIPSNIKSNAHSLKISFEDSSGNKASKEFSIFIIPKPTMLKTLLNKLDFSPNDKVIIEALLYDQANELIENNAEIKVYDTKNNLIKQGNYKIEFDLDNYALPGNWLIKAKTNDFSIESKFNVLEVKKLQTFIEDGVLYVKNVGNIPYNDIIEVQAIGEDGNQFTKKINIEPKESKAIDLSDEIKQGTYNVNVLANNEKESFESVNIPESDNPMYLTGKAISDTGNLVVDKPYIPLLIIIALALLFYFRNSRKRREKFSREKDVQLASMRAREIEQEKTKQGIKPRRFNIDEKEAKEFTDRIVKNIEREKGNEQGYMHRNPKDDKPGLFGMFD